MLKSLRCAVVLGILGIGAFACTVGTTPNGSAFVPAPQKQVQITSPTSGMQVTATISAVTLGDQCAATAGGSASAIGSADCGNASPPSSFADGGNASGVQPAPGCGTTYCQQSNVQIAFIAGAGQTPASVQIVSVTLLDAATGKVVDTLQPSKPQAWSGNGYVAWDQTVPPASDLKASYDLSAPAWSTLTGNDASKSTFSTPYKLDVTLRIDGVEVTLESAMLSREPPAVT